MKLNKFYMVIGWGLAVSIKAEAGLPENAGGSEFYGKVNVSLERQRLDGAARRVQSVDASTTEQWELNSNASRLGVRGEQSLQNTGLTAIYQAEYEINVDDGGNGDSAFSQRNIYGGLKGNFGEIRYGKFDTPLKSSEGRVDQFNDLKADLDNLIGGQNRAANIIQYSTSVFADTLVVTAALIPAEGSDVDADGLADSGPADTKSVSAVFDNKRIYAALAYEKDQLARRSLDNINRAQLVRLVSGYRVQNLELGGMYQQVEDAASASQRKDTSYLLSAGYSLGPLKYKAQYGHSTSQLSRESGTLVAVGADYLLAPTAILYTYWSSLRIDRESLLDRTFGIGISTTF